MISGLDDGRLQEPTFVNAPAIFPNNDIKFFVNKQRARIFAVTTGQLITWSQAQDNPSSAVLSDNPDVGRAKLQWLQRHDRDCGSLYGMLPLIVGMPVALTDHLDRNPKKNLLKGRVGYIDSWVESEKEVSAFDHEKRLLRHVPRIVFVLFCISVWDARKRCNVEQPCQWTIPGVDRAGIYPVFAWKRSWYLDQHRKVPRLEVKRYQIPLAPAYAMTAHASQGRTLLAAIIDLQLGRGVSIIASYVAMTRARLKTDILIFRPFDREVFNHGSPEGPTLLLKHLRHETIDWSEIENRLVPKKTCTGLCGLLRCLDEFDAKEIKNRTDPLCKACIVKLKTDGTPNRCTRCRMWFGEDAFNGSLHRRALTKNICHECKQHVLESRCCKCNENKPLEAFTPMQRRKALHQRECIACQDSCLICGGCKKARCFSSFPKSERSKPSGTWICSACTTKSCSNCHKSIKKTGFSSSQWNSVSSHMLCEQCDLKRCAACNKQKTYYQYQSRNWHIPDGDVQRKCIVCCSLSSCSQSYQGKKKGLWICQAKACRKQLPHGAFSRVISKYGPKVTGLSRKCNDCIQRQEQVEKDTLSESMQHVQKLKRE